MASSAAAVAFPQRPPCELSTQQSVAVDWCAAFPRAVRERERLRGLQDTFERLEHSPALVPFERHLDAVLDTARLAETLVTTPTLRSATELRFTHAGQDCNCVWFELYHRTLYLAERFLWLVSSDDKGGPQLRPMPPEQRAARTVLVKRVLGVLTHTQHACAQRWTDQPLALALSHDYLAHLARLVRAYGLWNHACQQLHGAALHALPLKTLSLALQLLTEAQRALLDVPQSFKVADGAFELRLTTVHASQQYEACESDDEPPPPTRPDHLQQRSWTEVLPTLLLHVASELCLSTEERGVALALARVLAARGEALPRHKEWERMNAAVFHQPRAKAERVAAYLGAVAGLPDVLCQGTPPTDSAFVLNE